MNNSTSEIKFSMIKVIYMLKKKKTLYRKQNIFSKSSKMSINQFSANHDDQRYVSTIPGQTKYAGK